MKRKTWISLMMALLMVFSTFTVVNAINSTETGPCENGNTLVPPGSIDFTKLVWNDTEGDWWDYTWAEVGDSVRFKITLTYHKNPENPNHWTLHHIQIIDELPESLEFADNVTFYNAPEIEEEIVDNIIYWNFPDYDPILDDGESMSIEFNATVIESGVAENENVASVTASECNEYTHEAESSAWVYVEQEPTPETIFEKKVLDGDIWSEETNTTVGSTVTFKITLIYYGEEYLHNISIVDYLPCCLEYAENANHTPSNISADLKTIWWNFTEILTDGDYIEITFEALVTGTTGCGCDGINIAVVDAYEGCNNIPYHAEDDAKVTATCGDPNVPPCWPFIYGDKSGLVGEELTFYVRAIDYNGDDVYYLIDWDDGTYDDWFGPFPSGEVVEVTHTWSEERTYWIRAKAKDVYEEESSWGNSWAVEITVNHPPSEPFICGDKSGEAEEVLTFYVVTTDPDGDDVYYWIEWGDGNNSGWIGPSPSGEVVEVTNTWSEGGTYEIKAKAKDIYNKESTWGDTWTVEITGKPPVELRIKLRAINIGRVRANIKNVGPESVSDVSWDISVNGGMFRLKKRIKAQGNGTIETLGAGAGQDVSTDNKIVLRVGIAKVTVIATVDGKPFDHTQYVIVIGRLILARPLLLKR